MSTYQEYIKLGWPCFPVAGPVYASNPENYDTWKVPLVKWQTFQNRFPTNEEIELWLKKWPLAWMGCTTGPFANLFIVDSDGEEGRQSLSKISMPITRIAKTQRGFHYFFRWSSKMEDYVTTVSDIKPGVDIRGKGGYIILPTPQAKREWVCEEMVAEFPDALYPWLKKDDTPLSANWRSEAIADLSVGNRHQTFIRLASSAMNAKWPLEDALAVLLSIAKEVGFEAEAEVDIRDVYKRYSAPISEAEKRTETMKDKTRKLTEFLEGRKSSDKCFKLCDLYDTAATQWVNESGTWEESEASFLALQIREIC